LNPVKKHLIIFGRYFKLNLASALEYRASFFTQAFGMALSNSSFIFFWWIAFGRIGGGIAGYSFEDVLFIWAVTSSGFGVGSILFANARRLTGLVVTGELDAFLLQPCNVLMNVLCAKTDLAAYGDLVYGIVIMSVFYLGDVQAWLWFLSGAVLFGALITAINLAAHSLSFFWGDASAIGQMANEFTINFSVYPDRIYAPAVRALMYSLIPAGVAVHIPLRLFREFSARVLAVSVCVAALYCVAAGFVFYRGLKRYESGNAIVTRQ